MASIISTIIDFLFLPNCFICGNFIEDYSSKLICSGCFSKIRLISGPTCSKCGIPFVSQVGKDRICSECLLNKKYFFRAKSVGYYRGEFLEIIRQFKYKGKTPLSFPLGNLLADRSFYPWDFIDFDLIIPVPLHKRRLRERGFNQSLLLAAQVGKKWNIPLDPLVLKRVRYTDPQTGLKKKERLKNIRGAFLVKKQKKIRDRRILLIDDVYTTGYTANECSRELIESGASKVGVLTLARMV